MWNLPERPVIDAATLRAWERGYVAINEAFARAVVAQARGDRRPRIMLHDYHLYCAAEPIRRARPRAIISHFTHIPMPPSSIWQTVSRRRSARASPPGSSPTTSSASRPSATRTTSCAWSSRSCPTRRSTTTRARCGGADARRASAHYPISIDVEATPDRRLQRAARRRADQLLGGTRERVIVRVDRLEPSKNILRGFLAYEALLQRQPRLRGRSASSPSSSPRGPGSRVRRLRPRGPERGRSINARFGRGGWRPIQLFYENDYAQALAGLSIADVVLVNPLVDGMNLVAKEAAVVSERDAVLVLSETAGAFDQMADGALPVAPADVVGTADALAAPWPCRPTERQRRLATLRRGVEREDITWWLRRQLEDLAELAG